MLSICLRCFFVIISGGEYDILGLTGIGRLGCSDVAFFLLSFVVWHFFSFPLKNVFRKHETCCQLERGRH